MQIFLVIISCITIKYSCNIITMSPKKFKRIVKRVLIEDESIELSKSKGNGILRRQIWVNEAGEVACYSLAYINHFFFSDDNGRVLCYDNAHGSHHKHYLGNVEPVEFKSFLEIEEKFQHEFEVLHEKIKKKK